MCFSGGSPGMTLRDYFAAKAMMSLMERGTRTLEQVCATAYAQADAMLAERLKGMK